MDHDVEAVADALELLEAFQKLQDPGVRRTVISLTRALRPGEDRLPEPPRRKPIVLSRMSSAAFLLIVLIGSFFALELLDPAPMDVAASVCHAIGKARL